MTNSSIEISRNGDDDHFLRRFHKNRPHALVRIEGSVPVLAERELLATFHAVPRRGRPSAGANRLLDFHEREAAFADVSQGMCGQTNGFHRVSLASSTIAISSSVSPYNS